MPITSSNMSLQTPSAGEVDYPTSIANSLTAIDTHDHSSGKGVPVPATSISGQILTVQITDLNVTTAKIAALNVTRAKLEAVGQQIATVGSFSTTSSAAVDVTGATVTITSTGRPIVIGYHGQLSCQRTGTAVSEPKSVITMLRGASIVQTQQIAFDIDPATGIAGTNRVDTPLAMMFLDAQAAGTYTYKIQLGSGAGDTNTSSTTLGQLFAYEL